MRRWVTWLGQALLFFWLQSFQASEISDFGLTTISLTAESLQAATKVGRNLLKEVCEGRWSVVLLSAERLVFPDVDSIIRNPSFPQNLVLLGIDETHDVVPWGKDFRQAYHQIPALRRRLPSHTALVAVSVTISPGNTFCSTLDSTSHPTEPWGCLRTSVRHFAGICVAVTVLLKSLAMGLSNCALVVGHCDGQEFLGPCSITERVLAILDIMLRRGLRL